MVVSAKTEGVRMDLSGGLRGGREAGRQPLVADQQWGMGPLTRPVRVLFGLAAGGRPPFPPARPPLCVMLRMHAQVLVCRSRAFS